MSDNRENREFFADSIGEITLSGGMVRMDFFTLQGSQSDKDNKPKLEFSQRIIMPPDGFLRSFSSMENLVKKLIDAGLVKPRDGEKPANTSQTGKATDANSPNF